MTSLQKEGIKGIITVCTEESKKAGLIFNIQKTKIMASGPITSWHLYGETMETVRDFIFGGSKITADVIAAMKLRLLGRKAMKNHSFDYVDLCWKNDVSAF